MDTVGIAAGNQNIESLAVPSMRGLSRETENTITPAQEKLCHTSGRRAEKSDRKKSPDEEPKEDLWMEREAAAG